MKDKNTLITMQQLRTCNVNKMNDKEKVITMYLRSSKGVRQIAKNLGLPFTFVGKIINQVNKSGIISYNNYI